MSSHVSLNQTVVTADELTDVRLLARNTVERMVDDGAQRCECLHDGTHNHATLHLRLGLGISYGLSERAHDLLLLTLTILTDAVNVGTDTTTNVRAGSTCS